MEIFMNQKTFKKWHRWAAKQTLRIRGLTHCKAELWHDAITLFPNCYIPTITPGKSCYRVTDNGHLVKDMTDEELATLSPAMKRLFLHLVLNHTVQLDRKEGVPVFKGK